MLLMGNLMLSNSKSKVGFDPTPRKRSYAMLLLAWVWKRICSRTRKTDIEINEPQFNALNHSHPGEVIAVDVQRLVVS